MSALDEYRKGTHQMPWELKQAADAAIAETEAEADKWRWVARDIAGAFPEAAAILADAISRWHPCEGADR